MEVPLQLTDHLENLRIVEPVHFHRELRNRREQFVWRCEKRFHSPPSMSILMIIRRPISPFFLIWFSSVSKNANPCSRRDFRRIRYER